MPRYRVAVNETLAIEYEVWVDAVNKHEALEAAEDPDSWAPGSLGREHALEAAVSDEPGEVSAVAAEREEEADAED